MRNLIISSFFLIASLLSFSGEGIHYFRTNFKEIRDKPSADKFLATQVEESNLQHAITIRAYKGVCKMMIAQYVSNPFSKYAWFNEGKELLEKSIQMGKNVENIHLRLLVQINAPSMLGYSSNIASDKAYLLKNIDSAKIPDATKKDILEALIASGKLPEFNTLAKKYKAK